MNRKKKEKNFKTIEERNYFFGKVDLFFTYEIF